MGMMCREGKERDVIYGVLSCIDEKEIARGRDDWQTTQRVIWVIVSEKERENYYNKGVELRHCAKRR